MGGYDPAAIEKKWQKIWDQTKVFAAASVSAKPKFYALDMFPYPSGEGLHVGHPEGYTASDIVSRYKRGKGFNVMHPMGWDAYGLPAEQYAIKTNTHPRVTTAKNIDRFRKQLQAIGFSYDWDREVDTTDPAYYRWTQWIFLKLYDTWFDEAAGKGRGIAELVGEFVSGQRAVPGGKSWGALSFAEQQRVLSGYRLAYEAEVPVNWCAGLGTVLANEEVVDGKSEVGGFPVERKPMKQWMLRITAYAERLLDGLDGLEWSESLKEMQRNWIGRSDGALVTFQVEGGRSLTVFTTRPDTLFGVTYMVMAPEHAMVGEIVTAAQREKVAAYQKWAAGRSDRERQEDTRKTGEFTGAYAVNPVNGEQVPIYISDYVLMGYGTGAIMAVPGHDERDHEFARKFGLKILQVVGKKDAPADVQKAAFVEEGVAVNSPWIEGLATRQAKEKMIALLEEKGIGRRQINYKIRDWLFSRQRYWGEPFPLVHLEDGTTVALAESELPLKLPELEDFRPTGTIDPPLSKAKAWWDVWVVLENGRARVVASGTAGAVRAKRELNTMPQWAGSCWYYLRYLDPKNEHAFIDPAIEKYWMGDAKNPGVDLYIGGVEHAVLHLLYSRFWHKVLFDHGLVSSQEPFRKLVNQGLILGEAEYTTFRTESGGELVSFEFVDANLDSRVGTDGKPEIISKDKRTGQLLVGEKRHAEEVEKRGDAFILKAHPEIRVDARSFKMSKSRGNVVNPDDVIATYGADALRLFEMFMGPLEQVKPWSMTGVEGVYRFLQRVWRNLFDENDQIKPQPNGRGDKIDRARNRVIKKVSDDIERLSFNTAISAMMSFNNLLAEEPVVPMAAAETLLRLLEPFAPHFAEEAFSRLLPGMVESISQLPWPAYDPAMLVDALIEVPVQVNGKVRGRVTVAHDADEATVLEAAKGDPDVQRFLESKPLKKQIYIKGRMVNLVV